MKLMDNAAGMCAAKYCHTNVVTASIDTIDFLHAVRNGQLVYARARPTYASQKSLEVEVLVEVEDMSGTRVPAAHAYFTFVSLDEAHKPLPVPPLKLQNPEDAERWQLGKQRYEARRAQRQAKQGTPTAATENAVAEKK
jgi:acyl-CoA hydrolase